MSKIIKMKKPNECDMVVTLTIPYVPNCKKSFIDNLPSYLTKDLFKSDLVIIDNVQMCNERYVEEMEDE